MQYGELYHRNFYREVTEKSRVHYEYYNLPMTEDAPDDYTGEAKRDSAKLLDKVVGMN